MKGLVFFMVWLIVLLMAGMVMASTKRTMVETAEQQLQATFKNLRFTSFKPGPVEGLFEINSGGSILYFHPGKQLLLMGEFYDKTGKNLTASAVDKNQQVVQNELPLAMALTLGPIDSVISVIEFTSPDCGYCKAFDRFVSDKDKVNPVKRQIFFDVGQSSTARQKALHILCADDKANAMHQLYMGIKPKAYLECKEGRQRLAAHGRASRLMGVRGTPSFIIDGKLTLGFSSEVKNYLSITNVNSGASTDSTLPKTKQSQDQGSQQ